jgi:hypothetical protein
LSEVDKGSTAKILGPFLDGMREAGASVELFYAKQLDARAVSPLSWFLSPVVLAAATFFEEDLGVFSETDWAECEHVDLFPRIDLRLLSVPARSQRRRDSSS